MGYGTTEDLVGFYRKFCLAEFRIQATLILASGSIQRLFILISGAGPAERIFKRGVRGVATMMQTRKHEQTRGILGHASPGKFKICVF